MAGGATAREGGPPPLLGLDAVDWGRRYDCSGGTDRVPVLLDRVWSGADAPGAVEELYERLVPEHGICTAVCVRDATPAAVPFLARLAQDARTPSRDLVMELLMRVVYAVDEGPVEACFGVWPDAWLARCGQALCETRTEAWFALLDEDPDPERRWRALRLLAVAAPLAGGGLALWLWRSALDAPDAGRLAERTIAAAFAARGDPWAWRDEEEDWVGLLREWLGVGDRLGEAPYPSPEQTAGAVGAALRHLPEWLADADTVAALADLLREAAPGGEDRAGTPETAGPGGPGGPVSG
ncbi:hypothetical protein J0910_16460 [Nocardiopsis sp. CNT-189]|uniref:hypothetical protein n=1 Tax=Nocardiopsis oceanisediminis TaxID=2816862 RepID=UPI003B335450